MSRARNVLTSLSLLVGLCLGSAPAGAREASPASAAPSTTSVADAAAGATVPGRRKAPAVGYVVTGQRFVRVGSRPALLGGGSAGSVTLVKQGHRYFVPPAAAAYVGRELDPSLFDVDRALNRRGRALPVVVHHRPGPLRIPGVTVTDDRAGVARGFVSRAAARRFGAALASDPAGTLAGVSRLSLPHPDASPSRSLARYPMRTVEFTATLADGTPMDFGIGVVMATDDTRFSDFVVIEGGRARMSLPVGTYSGFIPHTQRGEGPGAPRTSRLVAEDFEVTDTTTVQSVAFDLAEATSPVTVTTPRPAARSVTKANYLRTDAAGHSQSGTIMAVGADDRLLLEPLPVPAEGAIVYATTYSGFEKREDYPTSAYTYDLFLPSDHVDADLSYIVAESDLAPVRATYHADADPVMGQQIRMPVDRSIALGEYFLVQTPQARDEYVGGPAGTRWDVGAGADLGADDLSFLYSAVLPTYAAGVGSTETWRRGPIAPGFAAAAEAGGSLPPFCAACRTRTTLGLGLWPVTDSDPNHAGDMSGSADGRPAARATLIRDGKVLVHADNATGVSVPIRAAAAHYRLVVTADRVAARPHASTRSRTVLSFDSAAGEGPVAPPGMECPGCRVLPVLTAKVDYPADLGGLVQPGVVPFTVTAGRVPGAAPAAVTSVSLWLRPTGYGAARFPMTRDDEGLWRVDGELPDWLSGHSVDVRVVARDEDGSLWDQTVQRAFRLSGLPEGRGGAGPEPVAVARAACDADGPGYHCLARYRTGSGAFAPVGRGTGARVGLPRFGYRPADIASIYGLDPKHAGRRVAIVVAFDYPKAEQDLAAYRKAFGLPACSTANGCFRKIDQRGGTDYPEPDAGWALEAALDLQSVSAACPRCRILLVESDTNVSDDMGLAVNRAVAEGARIVSNSYGSTEGYSSAADDAAYYTHPGVAQVVASGDFGFVQASYPAASAHVIAVGGTKVTRTKAGWRHRAWTGAGSGCSAFTEKPSWQHDENCLMRTTSDISALSDPATGLAVYDTFGLGPDNGWIVVGGTSLAAPLVAGMIAQSPDPTRHDDASYLYQRRARLVDVIGGSNGSCGGDYLCTGLPGYDGPTGWGTPYRLKGL